MKTKFVAEVSSNHHANIDRCFEFIDTASRIGCQSVKFQLFKIDELFSKEILENSEDHRKRKAWELSVSFLSSLHSRCAYKGIEFSCTPFYLRAVDELYDYVSFYKIASYELLWSNLLVKCAKTKKPVVLSTGMATLSEVENAVTTLRANGCEDLTILHCVSGYPTPISDCNLSVIGLMREKFGCKVGWSDHTANPNVIRRAVETWGADMIEFHLDIDGTGDEYKIGHCWLPDEAERFIQYGLNNSIMDGTPIKSPSSSEMGDVLWRADPIDGLRPLIEKRAEWISGNRDVPVKAFRDNQK